MAALFGLTAGCGDSDSPRSHYRDLGTEARPLLPTAGPWHNAALKDGRAQWHPFRPLETEAVADADSAASSADSPAAGEIRELLQEYNAAVADGDYEQVAEFFIEEQAETVGAIVELMPKLRQKLEALKNAAAEASPEAVPTVVALLEAFSLERVLGLTVDSLDVATDTKVVGKLSAGLGLSPTTTGVEVPDALREVRFAFDEEEGYWFVDAAVVDELGARMPALEDALPLLDTLISALQSGQPSADARAAVLETMGALLWVAPPSDVQDAEGDPGDTSGNEDENSEPAPSPPE